MVQQMRFLSIDIFIALRKWDELKQRLFLPGRICDHRSEHLETSSHYGMYLTGCAKFHFVGGPRTPRKYLRRLSRLALIHKYNLCEQEPFETLRRGISRDHTHPEMSELKYR
jgi:hypothetical protein